MKSISSKLFQMPRTGTVYPSPIFSLIISRIASLSTIFVYFGLFGAVASIGILFWQGESVVLGYHLGIYCNRLIGVYTNSNILAFSMFSAVVADLSSKIILSFLIPFSIRYSFISSASVMVFDSLKPPHNMILEAGYSFAMFINRLSLYLKVSFS